MPRIIIDDEMREKLKGAREAVQIVDQDGHLLGTFKPIDVPPYDPSLIPPISEEELRQREQETGGYTTEEVLQRLREL
jgi:hypothetical protein